MNFPLIKELQNLNTTPKPGIKYQEYTIQLEDDTFQAIGIPLKEVDAFEQTVSDDKSVTKKELMGLLRKHRGIILDKE